MQIDKLRKAARNIQGNLGRCCYRRKDINEMQQVSDMLREAANTIESLRDRLQAAELGSGTCEIVAQTWEDRGGDEEDTYKYELSCGHAVRMLDCEPLHNCPRCGKAVR